MDSYDETKKKSIESELLEIQEAFLTEFESLVKQRDEIVTHARDRSQEQEKSELSINN